MDYTKDDIIELRATGKMSRRQFNTYMASLGAVAVTFPVFTGSASAAAEDHPNVFTWEGWDAPSIISNILTNMENGQILRFLEMKRRHSQRSGQALNLM